MEAAATPLVVERPRSADEIVARLQQLLDPDGAGTGPDRPLESALLRIAARHAEILTAHLNAAPGLHLAAFNRFLTGRPRPAAPARATLVFRAAPGSVPVVVPMHTQVAAPPRGDDPLPVVFETCDDLELVRATPVRACLVDAGHRRQADLAALFSAAGRDALADPLDAAAPVPQVLHLGHRAAFGVAGLRELRLQLQVDAPSGVGRALPLEFGIATPAGFEPLVLRSDTTAQWRRDGELVVEAPDAWPLAVVEGIESRWLSVRPAPVDAAPDTPDPLPRLRALALQVVAATGPEAPAAACANHVPLDTTKDFFALGERPRFGDVFEIRSPAFDAPGAHVELQVRMTHPAGDPASPIPAVRRDGRPVVAWEMSTPEGFRALSVADGTRSLTADGLLTFTVPPDVTATTIAGQTGAWLRGRLVSGHFGSVPAGHGTAIDIPCAPAIRTLTVSSTLSRGPFAPECTVREGAMTRIVEPGPAAGPFTPFAVPDVDGAALYLGFAGDRPFAAGRALSVQVRTAPPGPVAGAPPA